jgi:hypothetical protein
MGDCCGSTCSPINISDELPREITNDEKVTGTPELSGGFAAEDDDGDRD